ncbi:tRNA (adenosine(37)-N6)-threonylcarbamoyltransferase complex ATPase subunit type 1 TsaE [Gymnodinialimonas sp. 2305UL16-5]|uniref:tRNA (adenosine(37)-N6)-threonylcarbamoyltransferase complex ATPase subunit type 1 TsaE n=1 Tax=Gymnodinialimonas mytili TaxID=3126503 RepID=UPI0030999290
MADPVQIAIDPDSPQRPGWPVIAEATLVDDTATDALGAGLAKILQPGDTLLLSGGLGAGKTHLARALIRAALHHPEEPVPSPTFTLVQTYPLPGGIHIWHADLYRLGDPAELLELGLDEALGTDICLIEWPDRLAPDWPTDASLLHLAVNGTSRRAHLSLGPDARFGSQLTKVLTG